MRPRGCLKLPTLPSSNPPPTRLPLLPSPRPDAGPWVLPPQAVVDALALPPRRKRGPSIQPTQDGAAFARARLTGPLGAALPCIFEGDAGATEQELVGQLDSLTLQTSIDAGQPGRLQSALNWFDAFLAATRVVPFVPIEPGRELECYAYNQRTLERFSRFIRLRSSAQRGQPIKGDTISGYVSAIKIFRSKQAGMHVTSSQVNVHSYDVGRSDRRADGPPGDRSRCLGVGGSDFDAIATSTDRASDAGCQDFAVGHAAYSALLRGGEVGTTDGGCWDPRRDLTLDSVELHPPCEASDGRPWLSLWVCAIKDVSETRKPVPIPIRRRCTGVRGSDPRCSYDAIVEHWERRCRAVPHAQRSVEPLFVRPDGYLTGPTGQLSMCGPSPAAGRPCLASRPSTSGARASASVAQPTYRRSWAPNKAPESCANEGAGVRPSAISTHALPPRRSSTRRRRWQTQRVARSKRSFPAGHNRRTAEAARFCSGPLPMPLSCFSLSRALRFSSSLPALSLRFSSSLSALSLIMSGLFGYFC